MNGTVLITGASGFAGSHLLEHLAGRTGDQEPGNRELVAWSRSTPPALFAPLARWQQVDLADRNQVQRALRDVRPSAVFHCAGLPHVAQSWSDTAAPYAANVFGTHHLLDGLRRAGVSCRVLIAGSGAIYAPSHQPIAESDPIAPGSPYAHSKLAQEQLAIRSLREDRLDVIVSRAFNHTGPRQTPAFVAPSFARQIALIEQGRAEPVMRVGNLDTERDLSDVRDIVRAYALLMEHGEPGVIYNIASGIGRPIRAVLDALLARARLPIRVETDQALLRPKDLSALVGDAMRLREATGWEPTISFERMLDDLLEYWRAQA